MQTRDNIIQRHEHKIKVKFWTFGISTIFRKLFYYIKLLHIFANIREAKYRSPTGLNHSLYTLYFPGCLQCIQKLIDQINNNKILYRDN